MKPRTFMLIAGEASGDMLAAELVSALRTSLLAADGRPTSDVQPLRTELAPRFFGAGGPKMAAAGVELAFDLTQHAVVGVSEVLKKILEFRRLFLRLQKLAIEQQPDAIIGVDYGYFNLRFGHAIKQYVRRHRSAFVPWNPRLIQFVSPQVWASRPGRAYRLQADYDLVLSIFPFEKEWYAQRTPNLRVEFVGHPMRERLESAEDCGREPEGSGGRPRVILLPGSRADEVRRHLPLLCDTWETLQPQLPGASALMILPSQDLKAFAGRLCGPRKDFELQVGNLSAALARADLAITKSGTITLECAAAGVPAVVFYKTSWPTYVIGRQLVTVNYLAMPNLLANESIYPEFIQHEATAENLARAALGLLRDPTRRAVVKNKLAGVVASLGGPGAAHRAAAAIVNLLP